MPRFITNMPSNNMDLVITLAGGNPGAVSVLMELITKADEIDPDSAMASFLLPLFLDTHDIHEDKIWMLYKDVCKQDIHRMCLLMRTVQLGIAPSTAMTSYQPIDDDTWLQYANEVYANLPNFARHPELPQA